MSATEQLISERTFVDPYESMIAEALSDAQVNHHSPQKKVVVWPCNIWCELDELPEYTFMPKDYSIHEVDADATDEFVSAWVNSLVFTEETYGNDPLLSEMPADSN